MSSPGVGLNGRRCTETETVCNRETLGTDGDQLEVRWGQPMTNQESRQQSPSLREIKELKTGKV